MQRYNTSNCTSAVNNSTIGGPSIRDSARADTTSLPNFSLSARRSFPITTYKLKCDRESLNSRLGPPDFHPQAFNCPEETFTKEYVQSGYRENFEGIEEAKEVILTHVQSFSKPVIHRCKEAIRKRFRAINESRAQKRKAGQVYGIPLSSSLLAKHGVFPDQRPCSEDSRKKWIEGLSQPHKRLCLLANHVPLGYRRKSVIEILIKNNVPLLRATWFVKVTYLNQVHPGSTTISSGTYDKAQLSRTEIWTKDVVEYLQSLVDDFFSSNFQSTTGNRDRISQALYTGSLYHKNDSASGVNGDQPSLHFKWWYMVRMLQWHHSEGLLSTSYIIDWVLNQLQEKKLLEILQLLLPIIHGIIETIVLCQTYVRTLVGVAVCFIQESPPGGSDLVDNSRRAYTTAAVVELLRYLLMVVPDTFVALNCFPLPPLVVSNVRNNGCFLSKMPEDVGKIRNGAVEIASFRDKRLNGQHQSLSFDHVVLSIQKCANDLAKAASPGYPGHNMAKSVQALDKSLVLGDVREAYKFLFEDLCDGAVDESWISEVHPSLRSSLRWIGIVSSSFICSIFFLCEWSTCDFRDFRTAPPCDQKFTGRKDYSQMSIAIRLLKLKMKELQNLHGYKTHSCFEMDFFDKNQPNNMTVHDICNLKTEDKKNISYTDLFQSPGPLHDIIVSWIDQHEIDIGDGFKRKQLLIMELIRSGIFYPQAYVRQLIVSGIMDKDGPYTEQDRQKKHYRVLKRLPALFVRDALREAQIADIPLLLDVMHVYANERRLVLHGLFCDQQSPSKNANSFSREQKHHPSSRKDVSRTFANQWKSLSSPSNLSSSKMLKNDAVIEELKSAVSMFLHLPIPLSNDMGLDEFQGCVKKFIRSVGNKMDSFEETPGCDECRRVKRQKVNDERSPYPQGISPNPSDDEDTWWMRKVLKSYESFKLDPPLKPTKQAARGRQKIVRKTQSLAQLAASRIESSLGASSSHACDNRVYCPHHRPIMEGEAFKSVDGTKKVIYDDIVSIGKALKGLPFVEKRIISRWLINSVRQLVDEAEKSSVKVGQFSRQFCLTEERSSVRWKLGEEELSAILYFMDVTNDLVSGARFILGLLPKVISSLNSTIHGGRNMPLLVRTGNNHVCEVGEAFLLSSIRRYENVLAANDLIPDTLSATMHRAAAVMASNGRVLSSSSVTYSKYLLKKYGSVPSVMEWEKSFKATCDKRFLSELESGRSFDLEAGFHLGVPSGVEDPDDYFRQKISGGRLPRVGLNMRDIVQRHVEEAFNYFVSKEKKFLQSGFVGSAQKSNSIEKWDDGHQIAKQIVLGLIDCIRQTGGAGQEGDPSLVSSAVSAIVSNVGPALAKVPDFTVGSNYSNPTSSVPSLNFTRSIVRIHITCLCLLKEALGERHSRVFEIALATEASSCLFGVLGSRSQFQLSPEIRDSNANMSNDVLNNSSKVVIGRPTKITAAVSALVIGAVIHGITSLERMVAVFRLKEGLDVIRFLRSARCSSNGNARTAGTIRADDSIEPYVHWFRLLVGNCKNVCDGLIVELLGEASIIALSRMQQMLPLGLVFPPAYSIFALVIWKPFIINITAVNEGMQHLYQSLKVAIGDAIKHLSFRDVCMRDTHGFYGLIAADATDSEFAAILEHNGPNRHINVMAFIPLRGRLFLNSIIDCKMPNYIFSQDDGSRISALGELKVQCLENEAKILDKLVHALDTLQPAKFHWQWVELRLLLNEQALIEKLESHDDVSLVDAVHSLTPNPEKASASENESNFVEIILTRLLVRRDSAPLLSEVVHRFGKSLEDSMLLQAKWFLGGHDVLLGRKSIRQRLINIAESKGFSTKTQFWKPWGWTFCPLDVLPSKGDKRNFDATSLEEGEVVEDGTELKKYGTEPVQKFETEGDYSSKQHLTERALIELVLPCIHQSSDESRRSFASDLINQMSKIEQQINGATRGVNKQTGYVTSGLEGPANKSNSRKSIKSGSPGLSRRIASVVDSVPLSPSGLRASVSLRLQFLLRLLPIICVDGDPSGRNMRHTLASIILRLLGNRVVYDDVDPSFYVNTNLFRESLFDRLLLVLHGLLSGYQPSWLKLKPALKSANDSSRNFHGLDREVADGLQCDLDRMHLPEMIRWRIQSAMPGLVPICHRSITCQPLSISSSALMSLQPSLSFQVGNSNQLNKTTSASGRVSGNLTSKSSKALSLQQQNHDHDIEVDPWTLLEDGTGMSSSNSVGIGGSGDHTNAQAASWLKGTVRVRRADLTYIRAVDDDS